MAVTYLQYLRHLARPRVTTLGGRPRVVFDMDLFAAFSREMTDAERRDYECGMCEVRMPCARATS